MIRAPARNGRHHFPDLLAAESGPAFHDQWVISPAGSHMTRSRCAAPTVTAARECGPGGAAAPRRRPCAGGLLLPGTSVSAPRPARSSSDSPGCPAAPSGPSGSAVPGAQRPGGRPGWTTAGSSAGPRPIRSVVANMPRPASPAAGATCSRACASSLLLPPAGFPERRRDTLRSAVFMKSSLTCV